MSDQAETLVHQAFTSMPQLGTPLIEPGSNNVSLPWYRWFTNMWSRAGAGMQQISSAVFFQQNPVDAGAPISAYSSVTGEFLGEVQLTTTEGGPAEPQTLVGSPFEFTAKDTTGSLVVFGGKLEWSRDDGTTFYPVGLTGGSLRLLLNDIARVTWFDPDPPTVVWFPDNLEPL